MLSFLLFIMLVFSRRLWAGIFLVPYSHRAISHIGDNLKMCMLCNIAILKKFRTLVKACKITCKGNSLHYYLGYLKNVSPLHRSSMRGVTPSVWSALIVSVYTGPSMQWELTKYLFIMLNIFLSIFWCYLFFLMQ